MRQDILARIVITRRTGVSKVNPVLVSAIKRRGATFWLQLYRPILSEIISINRKTPTFSGCFAPICEKLFTRIQCPVSCSN